MTYQTSYSYRVKILLVCSGREIEPYVVTANGMIFSHVVMPLLRRAPFSTLLCVLLGFVAVYYL